MKAFSCFGIDAAIAAIFLGAVSPGCATTLTADLPVIDVTSGLAITIDANLTVPMIETDVDGIPRLFLRPALQSIYLWPAPNSGSLVSLNPAINPLVASGHVTIAATPALLSARGINLSAPLPVVRPFSGELTLRVAETPLPGALVLFGSGLAVIAVAGGYRRGTQRHRRRLT